MKKFLLFLMFALFCIPWAANAQTELTVYDGTTQNSYVPAYMGWFDDFTRSQFVIPADDLAEMTGGTISSIKFYTTSSNVPYTSVSTVDVYVMEVGYTTMTALEPKANGTIVYQGVLDVVTEGSGGSLTIEFSTPYTYGGGNLLIGIENTTDAGYKFIYFYGQQIAGAAWAGYNSSSLDNVTGSVQNFIPKTTFTFTPGETDCDMPTSIAVNNITTDGATVTWEGDGSAWNLRYKASADADFTMVNGLNSQSYTLTGLNGNTTYSVGVQTVCTGSTSTFKSTSFTTANPCAAPTNFVASNITGSSATISWTAGYQETEWTVKYKKSSESSWDNATSVSVNGTPTTSLTGLDGLTVYNVRVYNCTGESDPYLSGNFTTAASFPYSQDFSGSGIPTGWTQYSGLLANVMTGTALTSTSYGWSNGTSNSVLDGYHLYSNIYGTSCMKWIVTPAIPVESGARLTFDVAYTAYSGTAANPQTTGTDDKFVVLASTDNMATWTILRQWDNAGSEYVLNELTPTALHQIFDLADYAGQNVIVAFYGESTEGNADNNIHVDNVVFELTPSCDKPMNLAVNYTGGTTAEVSWESDASAFNIDVNGTVTNNVTNPYTLNGLELATAYTVMVQAVCGDATSEWTNSVSFTTDFCMPENSCQITYELSDDYGDGWNGNYINVVDVETEAILATWTISSSSSSASGTLAVCDGRAIQFQYVVSGTYSYPSENSWVIKDVNGEDIWEYESPSASMSQDYTVSCAVTSCRKPTDLAATDIFGHSAKLSWTENGEATEWVIDYNGTTVTVNENPYVLEGLTPETAYTVKVKPVCDEEKWSDEITFTTAVSCPAPNATVEPAANSATVTIAGEAETYNVRYRTSRGFNYGFEQAEAWTYTDFDPCTVYDGDGGTTYSLNNYTFTNQNYVGACIAFQNGINDNFAAHNGNAFGVMFNSSQGQSNDWFILPELAIASGDVFSFWGREITTQYGDETINVGIYGSSDGTFASLLAENVAVSTTEFTKFEYDLSEYAGQTIRLAINCVSNDVFGFMFDDIFVGNPNDDTWDYELTDVETPYTISDLTPETDYELQVQSVCGEEEESVWSTTISFTTLPTCAVPTELAVDNITTTSAVVSWVSEAESFDLDLNGEVIANVTNPYTLENLEPGTVYSVKVRANCGDNYSNWTSAYSFSTPCEAFDLPYEYGFETNDDILCWSTLSANSNNSMGVMDMTTSGIEDLDAYEGNKVFLLSSYNSAEAYDQVVITPEFNESTTENGVRVQFAYTGYGSGSETFMVGYSTTTNDLDEFTWSDEYEAVNSEWSLFDETYPAGTKYVAVYYTSEYQYYLMVDDFKFTEPVECEKIGPTAANGYEWKEDFENMTTSTKLFTGVTPQCWTVAHEYTSPSINHIGLEADTLPQLYRSFNTTENGHYSLRMKYRSLLAMPELDESIDLSRVRMSLNVRQPQTYYKLQIGVMSDLEDESTFVPVATVNNGSTSMLQFVCDFSGYTGEGRYIAFKNVGGSTSDPYCSNYLDDIVLTYLDEASCAIDAIPYKEDFEGFTTSGGASGVEPDCWEVISEDVALDATTKPQVYAGFNTTVSGHYSLRMKNRCVYAMPEFAEDVDVKDLTLSFSLRQAKSFYRLEVGVVDAAGNFEVVEEINNSSTNMEDVTVDFSTLESEGTGKRIAFHNILRNSAKYDYSYNYIDDINLYYTSEGPEGSKTMEFAGSDEMNADHYLDNIAVYPNPTTGMLHIDAVDVQKVECYSQMGQLVGVYDNVNELNISELANGVYMLRITVPQGVTMRKVVKR